MMRMIQREGTYRTGIWKVVNYGVHQCGNVRVVLRSEGSRDVWWIEVRSPRGKWVKRTPTKRPWGYCHAGAAKRGAALMSAWDRGTEFRPKGGA